MKLGTSSFCRRVRVVLIVGLSALSTRALSVVLCVVVCALETFGTARGRCRNPPHARAGLSCIVPFTSNDAFGGGRGGVRLSGRFRVERRRRVCLRVVGAWRDLVKEGRRRRDLDQRREALVLCRCFRAWRVLRAKSNLTPQVRPAILAAPVVGSRIIICDRGNGKGGLCRWRVPCASALAFRSRH